MTVLFRCPSYSTVCVFRHPDGNAEMEMEIHILLAKDLALGDLNNGFYVEFYLWVGCP